MQARVPDFDREQAIRTANALHRTLMERELPISQEGYARAASVLHRKAKTSAPVVIQGMQQLSLAFLVSDDAAAAKADSDRALLLQHRPAMLERGFARVDVYGRDYGYQMPHVRA